MGRIKELDRIPMVDAHIGHWTQADALPGGPFEITPGYGLPQLTAQRTEYHTKQETISTLEETELPLLRAERDALFGISPESDVGVWFWLNQYKPMVALRVGRRAPLTKTTPNLGKVQVDEYVVIVDRFLDHWTRVNAALSTPLTLGTFTRADLQAKHDQIDYKVKMVAYTQLTLNVDRAEREALFGDVLELERLDTSIVARLELYHAVVLTRFPNQPIANTLPRIFPEGSAGLPTFHSNHRVPQADRLMTWIEDPAMPNAAFIYLKEGAVELTQPYTQPTLPGSVVAQPEWIGVTLTDNQLDHLELRDVNGLTLARGVHDGDLPEPG